MLEPEKPQLKMVWSPANLTDILERAVPAGYRLQQCTEQAESSFVALMADCGWEFDQERLNYCRSRLLPDGWFAITESDSSTIVASAMSLHNYTGRSTFAGTLGWVGCLREHRGRGLGAVVVAAATARLLERGYHHVELYTEYFREPAIATYFRLGYVPYLYNADVEQLWQEVCEGIQQPFTPEDWPRGNNAYPKNP
ncbi:MAG: GNAT family N-acetyltransferase [Rubripirellula sp.]